MTITHTLSLSRTCEATAVREGHGLHAFGKYDLVDSACGREGDEREKDKVRNEEACAAGLKTYLMNIFREPSDHHSYPNSQPYL